MKNIFILCSILLFGLRGIQAQEVNEYLNKIPASKQATVFPDSLYSNTTWKNFYLRKDIQNAIDINQIDYGLLNACLFYATNKIRATYKKKPLEFNAQLRDVALIHSYNMVTQNFFSHDNPKASKFKTMKSRIDASGYKAQAMGENIAKRFLELAHPLTYIELANQTIDAFYHSPDHKANMLNPSFTENAQAVYFYKKNASPYVYFTVTQDYGTPLSK